MSVIYTIKNFAISLTTMALIIGFSSVMVPKYKSLSTLQEKRDTQELRKQKAQASIVDIRRQQQLFKTDARFVERVARRNGRVRPNETLVIMQD